MPISNINSGGDRNYSDILNSAGKNPVEDLSKKYGITYAKEDNGSLSIQDFFSLMITQLSNQDFMNPTSDSEYMSQLTQYSSLQAMQEMTKYTQQNYAMSMIGKDVSASKYSNGNQINETGPVQKLLIKDGEYEVQVNGKTFKLSQIQEVGSSLSSSVGSTGTGDSQNEPTVQVNTTVPVNQMSGSTTTVSDALG